jgi:hypothetical protein
MTNPRRLMVGKFGLDAYWQAFASIGPRHAAMARWVYVLGWQVSSTFARGWLAPEMDA